MIEIKKYKIFLSDLNDKVDLLYQLSPDEVHGLVGADVVGKLCTGNIKQLYSCLVLMETRLGWTLMGKTDTIETSDSTNSVMSLHVNDAKISDLWRLDALGILDPGENGSRQELEMAAEEHFNRSVKLDVDGRYVVSLPWIQGHPPLPTCKNVAERRLKGCVESLKRNGNLEAYEELFREWLQEGVIEEVKDSCKEESEHFLPHRAVVKENSTKRVRPVFDGSAREKNSPSINDCMEKGPNTVELIPAVMNRFRLKKIGVVANIRRAFLQIGLSESDRPYLKFLWWEGATKLLESFYVDNCVTSVKNPEELKKFIEESKLVLSTAKFELREWENSYNNQDCEDPLLKNEKNIPVLGLQWNLKNDFLTVDLRENIEDGTAVTKRKILSTVHKIFDPTTIAKKFEKWRRELSKLKEIEFPRCLIPNCEVPKSLTLHWGGWWERLIGIIKGILRKVLGRISLNLEEMNTVICDIEGVINQRHLTYISADVDDLTPLKPLTSMSLHDLKETGIPDSPECALDSS
ncbi:uncharacterized protein LOC118189930 [Stegodyphus dumicola]|uniref:uncharacterized protein LOC118189930 n=1 Tax=Stegodyphus dumicola TaxID=202533 RepID=UPI0015A7B651|nr:uncharacterized protein LOC118189930 [Stegodyphus dumicola]